MPNLNLAAPTILYRLSSAASVARDILHSFPNIRISLIVGIGGSAPCLKHDIRLSDVVVGVPISGKGGGVIQYDFGKAIQGQEFRETGFLNQPPTLLRTAVNGLMARYEFDGNQIREAVDGAIAKKPRLRKKCMRPGATTDRLYRDAVIRDKMAQRGVLCFKTEAAGLINHFPCLQGYAAITAAAYAKDLLSQITPSRVDTEKKIHDTLSSLYEVSQQHQNIAIDHRDIAKEHRDIMKKQLKTQEDFANERLSEKERECHQLFRLTSSSKDATYKWYKTRVEERVKDTCLWFLNHKHYREWLQQESGPLLVTADPGCGKSVLAKYLIDHSLLQLATVYYFFFKDQDQNTSRQALYALLHQLFLQKPPLIKHTMPQFNKDRHTLINSTQSLWEILQNAINNPEAGPIIIILDALDKYAKPEFMDLMRNMESQFHSNRSSKRENKLKYLLTCWPYKEITSQFHGLLQNFPNIRIPGEEESESISQEVNRVIIHRIKQISEKKRFSAKINSYLEKKLQETTHRTYLWVYLVFDYLEENFFLKKTQQEIEFIITAHPKNINEAYEKILNKPKNERLVRRALSIILAASRPLTLSEMNTAMSIDDTALYNTTNTFDDLDLGDESDFSSRLRSLCGLFISIYHGKIYFLHQTAREFLLADLASPVAIPSALNWYHSITTRQAHNTLAELCVFYLNLLNSSPGPITEADGKTNYSTAFLSYSAENWGAHFREAKIVDGAAIIPVALKICDPGLKSFSTWYTIYRQSCKTFCPRGSPTNLIIASYYGHYAVVRLLLNKGANVEAKDEIGQTPLSWAAENGHEAVVKLLVKRRADVGTKGRYGETPILKAANNGHEATVKLLVDKGADIMARDRLNRTPLLVAAENGHEAVVKLLLERGVDVEARHYLTGHTALLCAAENGHEAVVRLLLEKGANVDTKYKYGNTPLIFAADSREALVKLFLEKGANVKEMDRGGRTALSPNSFQKVGKDPNQANCLLERSQKPLNNHVLEQPPGHTRRMKLLVGEHDQPNLDTFRGKS
ncbi:hypothetical protein J3F84DRAFT_405362 [Trichoderma pleuroticola]